jgi:anti-sigma factor ChrR (cupin superfamily)
MSGREKGDEAIYDVIHHELTDELRELASLHGLGLLDAAEAERWENHMQRCAVCAAETRACGEVAALVMMSEAERMAASLPAGQPPARVKEALMRQIEEQQSPSAKPQYVPAPLPEPAASLILRANEGRWHQVLPGVEVKRLFVDPITKAVTSLVRVAAGAVYPAHIHRGFEHLYVLDGQIIFDDHVLNDGDYEVRSPDTKHTLARTAPDDGCLLLVINSGKDEFLP